MSHSAHIIARSSVVGWVIHPHVTTPVTSCQALLECFSKLSQPGRISTAPLVLPRPLQPLEPLGHRGRRACHTITQRDTRTQPQTRDTASKPLDKLNSLLYNTGVRGKRTNAGRSTPRILRAYTSTDTKPMTQKARKHLRA